MDDILITHELAQRPRRPPDYPAEASALAELSRELIANPAGVLPRLCDLVRDLCRADSAGVSILEPGGARGRFRWHAITGPFAVNLGGTLPREASPCGVVLEHDAVLLFRTPARAFPALRDVTPHVYESLLAPWHVEDRATGTLWAITHTPDRRFDAEDARLLERLARFAAAIQRMTMAIAAARERGDELERRVEERTHALRASEARLAVELQHRARLYELSRRLVAAGDLQAQLEEALDATITLHGADFGIVQLYEPATRTLRIIAHRGFHPDSLAALAAVSADDHSSCGRAVAHRQRVIVTDVVADPAYAPLRAIAAAAGYRAVQSTPLFGRDGVILGVLSTHFRQPHRPSERVLRLTDLYARFAAPVIAQSRAKEDFLHAVSHDLRTPLTAIRASLGFLAAGAERLGPEERDLLETAKRNTERLELLIDDLIAAGRLQAGALELQRAPFDLRGVAAEAVATVQPLLQAKEQSLVVDLPGPLPVNGDGRRLGQAILNLLANAHAHTPPGTRVVLSGQVEERHVRLTVEDDGPGIPLDEQAAIFARFHRSGGSGAGIGLAIVKGVVELHGGRVWIESTPGRGAAFHIVLPRRTGEG